MKTCAPRQWHDESTHLQMGHMGEVFRINPEFRILRLTSIESQPQNAELGR